MTGPSIVSAYVPLRDTLGKGAMGNYAGGLGFADFSATNGLTGNGSGMLYTSVKPSELGTSNAGGIGYWENNANFTGTSVAYPFGCLDTSQAKYYSTFFYSNATAGGYWGDPANSAVGSSGGVTTGGHVYMQRASATSREAFFNGVSVATNTTNDTAVGASDSYIWLMGLGNFHSGSNFPLYYWKGRCGCAYMTDGTMTSQNVADLDTLLRNLLFAPLGRPTA